MAIPNNFLRQLGGINDADRRGEVGSMQENISNF